jgi:HEAT repeat protein
MRVCMLIVLLFALPALAAEVPAGLRNWLQALDSAPTPEQIQRAGGSQTPQLLDRVIRDPKEISYVRHRAVGLLGQLDDPASLTRMQKLLNLPDDALRATAALAWLAGPARRHPQGTLPRIAALLADRAVQVRTATARGLAFLPDRPQVRALAVQQRAHEAHPDVRAALDAAIHKFDAPTNQH